MNPLIFHCNKNVFLKAFKPACSNSYTNAEQISDITAGYK